MHLILPLRAAIPVGARFVVALLLALGTAHAQQLPRENADAERERYQRMLEQGQDDSDSEGSGEDVHGRNFWFEYQRRYPYDVIPAGAQRTALVEMSRVSERLAAAAEKGGGSLFAANRWTAIGPTNVGGRVRAIALHPTNASTMYIGGASGGVWKTTNGGVSWSTTFDKQSALSIGSIAIDQRNPNTIYAGTGELRVASDIGYLADGVFKSTDAGATWRNIGLNNLSAVSRIVVHKDNSAIVYVTAGRLVTQPRYSQGAGLGTGNGFYRSSDGGVTWDQIITGEVAEMTVNPQDNNEILISTQNTVQRSRDGGLTFTPVNSGLQNLGRSIRMSMAYDPSNPSRIFLLQAWRNTTGQHTAHLYRSTDGGSGWTQVRALDNAFFRGQGDYNNCIAIDPNDPSHIVAGGIDLWRSTDAGENWQNVTRTFGRTFRSETSHPDHHIIVFDPNTPARVYVGSDGGVYVSDNSAATIRRLHAELPITQFHTVEVDQTRPFRVFGGTQDNQTQAGLGTATAYTNAWTTLLGGDGFWVVVDDTNPNIVYAESQFGDVHRINLLNLDADPVGIADNVPSNDGGGWSTPIAISPVDGRFYMGRTRLYRTANPRGAVTWETLTPGFATGTKATALTLSPSSASKIVIGNDDGDVRFSNDAGASWTRATGVPRRFATDLAFDPVDPNRVYATFSGFKAGHVFVSNNGGATFTDISANLPDIPANSIEVDPANNTHLFVGTDIGVFVSLDAGTSWFPFNEGLPVVPVADMKIHRSRRVLVVGTHGRSMFDVSIDDIVVPATLIAPVGGEAFATPGAVTVSWVGFNGPVNILLSTRTGEPYTVVASGVGGSTTTIDVPLLRSTTARIRVEAVAGGQSATSGDLTFNATSNIETIGSRGFVAEAIAFRRGQLWVTERGTDTIRRLRSGLLNVVGTVVRSGFDGTIRDLAYDEAGDAFFALVTDDDLSNPRVFRLDTTGARTATLTLPETLTAASGIALAPTGLAVATPGENGRVVVVDLNTGAELSSSRYSAVDGDWRRGLVWNGTTYLQGVVRTDDDLEFPSELQQLVVTDSARLRETMTVVVTSGAPVMFFDLAVDNAQQEQAIYYATDTSGTIYRFRGDGFSGIDGGFAPRSAASARLGRVAPNPLRDAATVTVGLARTETVTLDLVTVAGVRALRLFDGTLAAGSHEHRFDARLVASGVYYLVLATASGERVVTPVVVAR